MLKETEKMPFLIAIYVAVTRQLALHIKQMKIFCCLPVPMKAIIIIEEKAVGMRLTTKKVFAKS